ncbi:MAG: PQQ-dependent sugar dehydrogenase [Thermoanaerobaculia bacterium]
MTCRMSRSLTLLNLLLWSLAVVFAPEALHADAPDDLDLETIASGLVRPVAIRHSGDGSGRLFVVEQAGKIRVLKGGQVLADPFLDIEDLVQDDANEEGLLGLAFHPDFTNNGYFFVNYTHNPPTAKDRTIVARYAVSASDPDLADPASATILLEIEQDFSNHNGGNILFGPDGYLYIGMGDGGSSNDPNERSQDPGTLLGKMLRIDVDGMPPAEPNDLCGLKAAYGIPPDNPYIGGSGDCDEIWGLGLRNPWRWSFDRYTGDMFIGDVGQNAIEEIDLEPWPSAGGMNWGWDCFEAGTANPNDPSPLCGAAHLYDFPILEYAHSLGCSVTGGYRYRGQSIVGLAGTYIFGDYCSGRIWLGTQRSDGRWTQSLWRTTSHSISAFGEDESGELYLVDLGGTILRFISASSIFADGFESGNTAEWP